MAEQNSPRAWLNALTAGHGIETDVRQSGGELFLSHDPITHASRAIPWAQLVELRSAFPRALFFLNIKEDGLLASLKPWLEKWLDFPTVCFDMSVPELVRYAQELPPSQLATRTSEWERAPLGQHCDWLWCDGFTSSHCPTEIEPILAAGKNLSFVSPRLHDYSTDGFLSRVGRWASQHPGHVVVCDDTPVGDLK